MDATTGAGQTAAVTVGRSGAPFWQASPTAPARPGGGLIRAYIGLGSNLGDPPGNLRSALHALTRLPGTSCVAHSGLYRNPPMGPQDQPDYVNAAAALDTRLSPWRLLGLLRQVEDCHGRVRDPIRWGPRSLDLDLLVYDGLRLKTRNLMLPHPGLHQRAFVLYPLAEIAPALVIPGRGRLQSWLARCSPRGLKRVLR